MVRVLDDYLANLKTMLHSLNSFSIVLINDIICPSDYRMT